MKVLGLKVSSHDTGAALISEGKIIAISEERLNRVKHSPDTFPILSIKYCLETLGVNPEEIDLLVIDQIGFRSRNSMPDKLHANTGGIFSKAKISVISHHDAHAAATFFASPFDDAAVLVYDGAGEKFETYLGVLAKETETLYIGRGSTLETIQKTLHSFYREFSNTSTFGIGKLYSYITIDYLGFRKFDEGKMMGLAPYGNDTILKQFPKELWFREMYGHIVCNYLFSHKEEPFSQKIARASFSELVKKAGRKIFYKIKSVINMYSAGGDGRSLPERYPNIFSTSRIFSPIIFPRPPRRPEDPLPDDYYSSVAYAAQKVLEEVALLWGKKLKNITSSKNLCIGGGVGLNIDANKKLLDEAGFENIFIQPACSDAGNPLGCALYGWHVLLNQPRLTAMKNASLGRVYSEEEIMRALEKRKDEIVVKKSQNVAEETARLIAGENIIGWFYGGAEYGPRALGNRSILCDPRKAEMKDIVNNRVKHREPWRPFAASVLLEAVPDYFEFDGESPFMLLAIPTRKEKQKEIPAVVHVDGTCRIQSVTKEDNGRFYDLIHAFKNITGVPLILNTSFNLAGDPIVETPDDAIECFLKTKIDYLILEEYIVSKK